MRTSIDIDEKLISEIRSRTNVKTKREAVHVALKHYANFLARLELVNLRGKVKWEGDLRKMREK